MACDLLPTSAHLALVQGLLCVVGFDGYFKYRLS